MITLIQEIALKAKNEVQKEEQLLKQKLEEENKQIFPVELGPWIGDWSFSGHFANLKFPFDGDSYLASISRQTTKQKGKKPPKISYSLQVRGPIKRLLFVEDIPPEHLSKESVCKAIAAAVVGRPGDAELALGAFGDD